MLLRDKDREEIIRIARQTLPLPVELWAYGSRVAGSAHDTSDLDLVVRGENLMPMNIRKFTVFTDALNESTIPILIQAFDWARIPDTFRENILKRHEVLAVVGAADGAMLPSEWREVRLGEVVQINPAEKLKKGMTAKKVNMDVIVPHRKKILNYSLDEYSGGAKFKNGDTIMARITPCLENGKISYVDMLDDGEVAFGSTEFIVLRETSKVTDKNFIYYFAINPDFMNHAIKSMTGTSGRQRVQTEEVVNYKFWLPPLPEQKAIAEVLSCLDDKIDLLHRQNKTLQDMAQLLFRSQFSENTVDKWNEVPLGDSALSKIIGSGIQEYQQEKIYLATADVKGDSIVNESTMVTYGDRPSRANMQPVEYSVWFAKKGGVRKVLMFDEHSNNIDNTILSTGFSGLKTTALSHYYVWCHVFSADFQEIKDSMLSGSVQPDINNDGINSIQIPMPDADTLKAFNKKVAPMFAKIALNKKQIRTLHQTRNTLLPQLISGKIRVKS